MGKRSRIRSRDEDLQKLNDDPIYRRSNLQYATLAFTAHKLRKLLNAELEKAPNVSTTFYPEGDQVIVKSVTYPERTKIRHVTGKISRAGQRQRINIRYAKAHRRELCRLQRERQRRAYFGFKSTRRKKMPRGSGSGRFTKRC